MQKGATYDKRTWSVFVEDNANDRAESKEKKYLKRGNPSNGAA